MNWTAEITNDPKRDYELYIELLENDKYKGRLQCDDNGELQLTFYGGRKVTIPFLWLSKIAKQAEIDLAECKKNRNGENKPKKRKRVGGKTKNENGD